MFNLIIVLSMIAQSPSQYSQAYEKSAADNRPLMVLVGADWCPSCVIMKKTLKILKDGGDLETVNFAYVDMDTEEDTANRLILNNRKIPHLIIYNKDGNNRWTKDIIIGSASEEAIKEFIKKNTKLSSVQKEVDNRIVGY